jgi:hypothetical protein
MVLLPVSDFPALAIWDGNENIRGATSARNNDARIPGCRRACVDLELCG